MQMQGTPQSGRPAALFVSLTRSVCRSFPRDLSTDYRGCNSGTFHQSSVPDSKNTSAACQLIAISLLAYEALVNLDLQVSGFRPTNLARNY
jgi:hypothetical protein